MRCPACGRVVTEGAALCRACGHVLDDALVDGAVSDGAPSGFTVTNGLAPVRPASADLPPTEIGGISEAELEALRRDFDGDDGDDDDLGLHDPTITDTSMPGASQGAQPASAPSAPVASIDEITDLVGGPTDQVPGGFKIPPSLVDPNDATVVRGPPPRPIKKK